MKIPFLDLKAQYATIREEVLRAVTEVLDSQVCIGGPKVAELEQHIAEISNCRFAVGVSSGTDALLCTLMALGLGAGDEVITTPFTFFATAGSIARTGATPVFVDIDSQTYNIAPELIEAAVTPRTRAIMPVHLFGQMCDMDPIMEIASRHRLYVIEDAAQSITATYKGRKAGSIGTAGCFSFFPSKNLGAAGDGGMVVTNDESLYQKLMMMRNHGAKPKYFHTYIGGNFRLDPVQAAILTAKANRLDSWSERRRANAAVYDRLLAGAALTTPFVRHDCVSVFNQYVILVDNRDEVRSALEQAGVGTEVYYPVPLHQQKCFHGIVPASTRLPVAESAAQHALALPVYPEMTLEMIAYVSSTVLMATSNARVAAV